MIITIRSTDKLTEIDGVPVRVWEGMVDSGPYRKQIPCLVFVHRLAVKYDEDKLQFESELEAMPTPKEINLKEL